MDRLEFIIAFEFGLVTKDEIIENFQAMIDDGSVQQLQGFYRRTAQSLIEQGYCVPKKLTRPARA